MYSMLLDSNFINIINLSQFRLRKEISTVNAIDSLLKTIICDLSKEFDCVNISNTMESK